MKKKILLLVLLLILTLSVFAFTSCGDDESSESGKGGEYCEHSWNESVLREASCYEYGELNLYCKLCGEERYESIEPLGHDAVVSEGSAATCTEGGLTDGSVCNRCGYIIEEQSYLSPLGHTVVTLDGSEPSCTEGGLSEGSYCSTCNTVFDEQYEIDPSGHRWEYSYGYDASCTYAGLTDGKFCWVCDYVETAQEVIPATGHTPETDAGYAATCLTEGLTDGAHCSVCYETITEREPIPATGHTIVSLSDTPATCMADGVKGGKECSACGVVFEAPTTLKKVNHSFENGSCIWCELTQSIGLEFTILDAETCELSGIGSFAGSLLVIPEEYEEKSVIGIAEGALQNQTQLEQIIITGRLEYIEANAFSGCTALVSVTLPETVTEVKANAFNGCSETLTVKCADFSQTESWEDGWRGSSTSVSLSADEKDGLTPYELYLAAMDFINANLDSYTAIDNTRLVMDGNASYPSEISQYLNMLEMETYTVCEYSGLEFYLYQRTSGYGGTTSTAHWYYNGYFYQSVTGSASEKRKCGSEFIRAQFAAAASEKRAQFTEKFFNSVKFYMNTNGTYTLVVDVSGDAMTEFLASQEGGSFVGQTGFSYTSVVYKYEFDSEGKLMTCSCVADFEFANVAVDSYGNPLSLTGAVLLNQTYSDVGTLSTIKTKPSGSFTDITPQGVASCDHPSYYQQTVKGTPATCTEAGITDGVYCRACLQNITASEVIEPLGHTMVNGKCEVCQTEEAPQVNLFFEFNSDGKTATLIGVSGIKGNELVIPSSIHGIAITGIAKDAFKDAGYIRSLVIPSSVITIEEGALDGIKGLKTVSLPTSLLASLPKDITEVIITEGETIPAGSFVDFKLLFKITLPETLQTIEDGAFVGCDRLLVICNYSSYLYNIYAGSTGYGGIAANAQEVLYRTNTSSLIISGDFVFKKNNYSSNYELIKYFGSEENVVLPESINDSEYSVQASAFLNCSTIKSIIAPAFATSSGYAGGCTSLLYVEGSASFIDSFTNPYYTDSIVEEVVVIGDSTYSYFLESNDSIKKATFYAPINSYVLSGASKLETVILGEGVTSIGAAAFKNCPALKTIYLSKDITSISNNVLSGSTTDYELYIEDVGAWCKTVYSISYSNKPTILLNAKAVYFDGELATDLVVPEGITEIKEYSFYGLSSLKTVSLPASLTEIKDYAFFDCSALESVNFSEGLTSIGNFAFGNASSLKSATLPDTLTALGGCAFQECTSLKSVYIPALLSIVRESCFYGCTALTTVTFAENSQTYQIDSCAFQNCKRLTAIEIPSTVTFLGSKVFYGCSSLREIDLSELSITEIYNETFYRCSSLKRAYLPENLEKIYESAFRESGLVTITLPQSLNAINTQAFYDCTSLFEVVNNSASISVTANSTANGYVGKYAAIVTTGASTLEYIGDFGFINTGSSILVVDYVGASRNVVFPDDYKGSTYEIPKSVFRKSNFVTVVISDGVTKIGEYAFANSYDLVSVSLGASLTTYNSIGNYAFDCCYKLVEVINHTPLSSFNSSTRVDYYAKIVHSEASKIDYVDDFVFITVDGVHYLLAYLGYADTVVLPESYKGESYAVYTEAFYSLGAKEIILSENITYIPRDAFDMYSVKYNTYENVMYLGTLDNPYYIAIGIIDNGIKDVALHPDTVEILEYAFAEKSFDTFTFNSSLKVIGERAFERTKFGLYSQTPTVTLPASLEVIRERAFYSTSIEYLDLGGVKRIEDEAFSYTNVHDIVIPESVTYLGYDVFANCGRSTVNIYYNAKNATTHGSRVFSSSNVDSPINVIIGAGVETIPNSLFYHSYNYSAYNFSIQSFTLTTPETLKKLGSYTFYGSALTEINLPAIVEIGNYAFAESQNLTSVTLGNSLTYVGNYAFYKCTALENVSIPAGAELGDNIFSGCTTMKSVSLPLASKTLANLFGSSVPSSLTKVTLVGNSVCDSALSGLTGITEIELAPTVKTIGSSAFKKTKVTSVTLPEGLESIGTNAFADCTSLVTATIPANVTSIEKFVFAGCTKLEYLEVPYMGSNPDANDYTLTHFFNSQYSSVPQTLLTVKVSVAKAIPQNAFSGDGRYYITTIILPENLESIGSSAFYSLTTLKNINIPDTVKTIGTSAFWNCPSIEELNIPASLTRIEAGTYAYCTSLKSIIVPEGVTYVGTMAFFGCNAATEISLPSTLEFLGEDALPTISDSMLTKSGNAYYLGNAENSFVVLYKAVSTDITSCEIVAGTKVIAPRAFAVCKNLTEISFPESVTAIGAYAFSESGLTKVILTDNVKYLGNSAFRQLGALEEVVIGDGVETIPEYCFYYTNGGIAKLTLGSGVKVIDNYAFGYTAITSLYVPSLESYLGIELKGTYATPFSSATSLYVGDSETPLTDLVIPAEVTKISNYAFANFTKLETLTVGDHVTAIGYYAFSSCTSLHSVTLGNSIEVIDTQTFANCSALYYVELPASVTTVNTEAFYNSGLRAIYLHEGVTKVYSRAFYNDRIVICVAAETKPTTYYSGWDSGSTKVIYGSDGPVFDENGVIYAISSDNTAIVAGTLSGTGDVVIPDKINGASVTQISRGAFRGSKITSIVLGKNITTIPTQAFRDAKSLISVDLSATKVDYIDTYAFYNCTSLETVKLPATLATIGSYAFASCTALSDIEFNEALAVIDTNAFEDCDSLVSIVIPDSVKAIKKYAFSSCSGLTSVVIGSGVTSIEGSAFYGCHNLKSATFKNVNGWSNTNGSVAISETNLEANAKVLINNKALTRS